MFTGIVQGTGTVQSANDHEGLRSLLIEAPPPIADGVAIGASISVDGVCLTVSGIMVPNLIQFSMILPTAGRTTLGRCRTGDVVNLERAARYGDEIGGHFVSGHVDFAAPLVAVSASGSNKTLRVEIPSGFEDYFLPRGFIAIDGASLTISSRNRVENWFEVALIPETRRITALEHKREGEFVNVEIDRTTQAIVDTTRAVAKNMLGAVPSEVMA